MSKSVQIIASDIETARKQINKKISNSEIILSEKVISDGESKKIIETGRSADVAFNKASQHIPKDAEIISKNIITEHSSKSEVIWGYTEEEAKEKVSFKAEGLIIDKIVLKEHGKKGFMGFGCKPNCYEILLKGVTVSIKYRSKAVVRFKIGNRVPTVPTPQNEIRMGLLCDVCNRNLGEKEGYLLTTLQVVSTPKYWEKAFSGHMGTMMSAFGMSDDSFKAQFASRMASQITPWIVCNDCIGIFNIDKAKTRQYAIRWHESSGTFTPSGSGAVPLSKVNMGNGKVYVQGGSPEALDLANRLKSAQ